MSLEKIRGIEAKWQKVWRESKVFEADPDPTKPKMFVTFPYPYLNGLGHIGHLYTFMKAEIYARYMRMRGYNVLFPQAFHATGQPIVAAARRLREGDQEYIKILKSMGIPEDKIDLFYDPKYWIKHFMARWIKVLKAYGASIDWRRTFHTTELNPAYDKFIQWQFRKLREKGLIIRAKHPVVWCPKEKIPVGDHDRQEGEGVMPEEIVVIKFKMGGKILPAATYRPETTYGVTNMWINPHATYVEAEVNKEGWIISKECVDKLHHLGWDVKIKREIPGEELLGTYVENPVTGKRVPVLPGIFVDPNFATGVVMSVPAHAPYDWIALEDLKKDEKWGAVVQKIKPISLIELRGYSDLPARDACEKYGIRSQKDVELLDKATEEVYKKEFYEGKLKSLFGEFAGMTVREAKEAIIKMFVKHGWATTMWILPEKVVCRCGSECVVHVVDQWFLKYSDPHWKALAHDAVENTVWIPPEAKQMVHHTIDWLRDWACTRDVKASLGTRLPWDKNQYIESLSDSTIYMAYYTIAKYLQNPDDYGIDVSKLNDTFFDYVFLGMGDAETVSETTGIPKRIIEEMRREFEYWYPVDLRVTGKDLVQNHLTFSIFHHAVIFPGKHIRQWGVGGWMTLSGEKMSKSKGNIISMEEALEMFGADATRFAEAYAGNTTLDDATFDLDLARSLSEKLLDWINYVATTYNAGEEKEFDAIDKWALSKIQDAIREVREAYELLRTRDVINIAWYGMWNLIRKYTNLKNVPNNKVLRYAVDVWIRMLAPIIPHSCEEAWHRVGKETLVSVENFPEVEGKYIDRRAEALVEYALSVIDDARKVLKLAKIEHPKRVVIVLAKADLYSILPTIKEHVKKGDIEKAIQLIPKEYKSVLAPIVQRATKNPDKIPNVIGDQIDEEKVLNAMKSFMVKELGVDVVVSRDYNHPKAERALPFKPAIIVE